MMLQRPTNWQLEDHHVPEERWCADACQPACFPNHCPGLKNGFHSRDLLFWDRGAPEFHTSFASAPSPGEYAMTFGTAVRLRLNRHVALPFGTG